MYLFGVISHLGPSVIAGRLWLHYSLSTSRRSARNMTKIGKKATEQKDSVPPKATMHFVIFFSLENSSNSSTVLFPLGTRDEKHTEQNDLANLWVAQIRPCAQFCFTDCEPTHRLTTHLAIRHLQQQAPLCQLCSITGSGACCSHMAGRSQTKARGVPPRRCGHYLASTLGCLLTLSSMW